MAQKRKVITYKCFSIILSCFFSINTYSQVSDCSKSNKLIRLLEAKHIEPKVIDDEFSEQLFYNFLKSLDSDNLYFTNGDIEILNQHKTILDDLIKKEDCDFLKEFTAIYLKRLKSVKEMLLTSLDNPIHFNKEESIILKNTKKINQIDYIAENEQKEVIRKYVKYKVLERMFMSYDTTKVSVQEAMKKEKEARVSLKKSYEKQFERYLNYSAGFNELVHYIFNNAIAECYDPHTNFFEPDDLNDFKESLSNEISSFGFDVDENDAGEIFISGLIPGGSAWNSNQLNTNDVILKLKPENNMEIDVESVDLKEFMNDLALIEDNQIELTVRKQNSTLKQVYLAKSKVSADDNIIKSYILSGDKKVGYISLPGFYTDWSGSNLVPLGCANDMGKEILKLQKEGIDGLIIDLRNNGGGSMYEAQSLSGIFLDWGALFINAPRGESPVVEKDMNRGVAYDGPLVVMVNGLSASASEVVAGTLQDYNRAVIVGSKTFGKATSQQIMPLDMNLLRYNPDDPSVKVTTSRLYRITQSTHQLYGVEPDILFPGIMEFYEVNERSFPNALKPNKIDKKAYYTALEPLLIDSLSKWSKIRQTQSKHFEVLVQMQEEAKRLNNLKELEVPLEINAFEKYINNNDKWSDYEKMFEETSNKYSVINDTYTSQSLEFNDYLNKQNQDRKLDIAKDVYIEESFYIISDLIKLQNE